MRTNTAAARPSSFGMKPTYWTTMLCTMPMISPPTIAPPRLSRPPSAAAAAEKISTRAITLGSSWNTGLAT